jgi:hypothetical protein
MEIQTAFSNSLAMPAELFNTLIAVTTGKSFHNIFECPVLWARYGIYNNYIQKQQSNILKDYLSIVDVVRFGVLTPVTMMTAAFWDA